MDGVTWIEVDGRHRAQALRERVHGDALTLGRAWDNDVVIDDPHVAAHHLRLQRGDDGRWVARDLGSRNGLQVEGRRGSHAEVVVEPGTVLRIGHTLVRLRHGDEPVADEQPLARGGSPWPYAIAALALVLLLALLDIRLADTGEPKLARYLTSVFALIAVVLAWTSGWAVVSRLFHGHASFGRHLRIAACALLAYSLYDLASGYGAFALSMPPLARFVYAGAWVLFGLACFAHLRALGPARLRLKGAVVVVLVALGIGTQTLKLDDWRVAAGQPPILQRLAPPWMRVVAAQAPAAFLDEAAMLRASLDATRAEEPAVPDFGEGETGD